MSYTCIAQKQYQQKVFIHLRNHKNVLEIGENSAARTAFILKQFVAFGAHFHPIISSKFLGKFQVLRLSLRHFPCEISLLLLYRYYIYYAKDCLASKLTNPLLLGYRNQIMCIEQQVMSLFIQCSKVVILIGSFVATVHYY